MNDYEDRRKNDVELALLRQEFETLKEDFNELKTEIRELVTAFNTASGLLRWVKWLALFIAGCVGTWSAYKGIK